MNNFDKYVIQELGAVIGNLTVENSGLKVQLQQAQATAHALADRLKKYENEDGVPYGDTTQKES